MKKVAETGVQMTTLTRAQVAASTGRRKRKVECCQGEFSYSTSFFQLRRSRRLRVAVTPEENSTENTADSNSNDRCASCCSSKGSSDQAENDNSKFVDPEKEEGSTEIVTSTYESENCRERRETTPSSEVQAESGEMESTAVRPSSSSSEENSSRRRRSRDDKMPSKAELEEFFSAAEKKLHEQFAQKYNFDVVKEEPLEGRYEWVRVKP